MKGITNYIKEAKKHSTVYFLVGIPGAGKSTWCKQNHSDLPVVSRDIIRAELGYTESVDQKARLEFWQENKVTNREHELIKQYLKSGQDFIIDDTNLKIKYRKPMFTLLRQFHATIIGVNFNTPIDVCIERRKGQIDAETIQKMASQMNPLERDEVDKLIEVK
jgi:predicted kinase